MHVIGKEGEREGRCGLDRSSLPEKMTRLRKANKKEKMFSFAFFFFLFHPAIDRKRLRKIARVRRRFCRFEIDLYLDAGVDR